MLALNASSVLERLPILQTKLPQAPVESAALPVRRLRGEQVLHREVQASTITQAVDLVNSIANAPLVVSSPAPQMAPIV